MAPLVSDQGSALLDVDSSSILSTSDTASASSDILRHQDVSSTSHQSRLPERDQLEQRQPQRQSQHHQQKLQTVPQLDLQAKIQTQQISDADTHHRRRLSSLTSAVWTPVASGVASTSTPALPHPLRSPVKRKPLSSSTSFLAASVSVRDSAGAIPPPLNSELFSKPDQRFARSPSIDSPTFYDYLQSSRTSIPTSK